MTDDHTPVELSWSWGTGYEAPVVRFSFEPIGPLAGTDADPLNANAAFAFMKGLRKTLPYLDLRWFDHFSNNLLSFDNNTAPMSKEKGPMGNKSRVFLAFDLLEACVIPKAYFFPEFKATGMGQETMDTIWKAIEYLPNDCELEFPSFHTLHRFTKKSQLEIEMLAIDCVESATARLKIYIRNRSTSWDSVRYMVTFGGLVDNVNIRKSLEELDLLWTILFRLEDELPPNQELTHNDHRTAGILYNYELRPGSSTLIPKVYIPVRHYMQNDSKIVQRLQLYLRVRKLGSSAARYADALKQIL